MNFDDVSTLQLVMLMLILEEHYSNCTSIANDTSISLQEADLFIF